MPKILKRSLALFLALMMCFSLVPASAFAVEDEAAVNQAEETVLPEENQPEELPDAAEQLPAPEESPAPEEGGEEAEKAPEQEEAPVTEETPEEPEAPAPAFETVKVCFVCEAPVDLSGLTVYGSGGAVLEPYYDEDSSEASFGVYYLAPGEYTYSFHDESGVYADAENIAFTVSSAEAEQTVEIVLTEAEEEPLPGVEVHSFTYINPLYEDVVDESDIPEVEFTQEDYDEFTALIEGEAKSPKASAANGMHLFAAFNAGAGEIIHTSVADAADELRPYLAAREPSITIAISSPTEPEEVDYETLANEIFSGAAIHTGNPTEGDYLSFQHGGYGGNVSISQKGSDYIYRFTYKPLYYTTATQEDQMTMKVNSVLSGLNLSGKTEYQKIKAIYGYLCDNVRYDYANLRDEDYFLKYTGYAALVNGTAVCQGYSVAFYRLCLEAGIDARVVSSVKMNHAWNIAKYVNNYYELDSTWDEGKTFDNYLYFLRGSTYWISSHKYAGVSTIGDEFNNSAFKAAYNLSSSDAPKYYTVSYNANGGTGAPGPQDKLKGNSILLSTIAPTHPRTEFLGWATSKNATTAKYQPGDTFSTDADTTLYAVWKITYIVPDGICGNELSWTLDTAGRLTVFGSGAMPDYASSADTPWHNYSDFIKSVIIDDGVTKIGKYAFRDCGRLTSVIIPASVTSIGTGAFRACGALASISVVSSNTAYSSAGNCLIEIASGKLIRGCNNSVIPAEGVTSIGDFSFDGCTGLKSITIPSTVTAIGTNAFYNCSSLTSISIPAGVKSIGTYAFLGCTALKSITVESGNTAYSGAGNCLIGIDSHTLISGCNNSVIPAEGITSISDYAFYGCSGLAGATIPEGVTSIGMQAFRGCSSLASITLPESLTSIGEYAFFGCSKLASVCFNGTASQETALRTGMSRGNEALNITWVILKDKGSCGTSLTWKLDTNGLLTVSGTGAMADYGSVVAPWYNYRNLIKSAIIGNGVTTIGSNAFWGCTELSSITIPASVTSIGEYAFAYCNLASITIPYGVTTIGGNAFNGCKRLTSFTLPEGLTTIGSLAFQDCTGLTSITIPASVKTIGDYAFERCSALTSISVVSGNTVYSGDCNCLIEKGSGTLILGCKNSEIPEGVTSIGNSAFSGCTGLTSITIPSFVTSISSNAFNGCTGLTSITIPSSVTSVSSNAFEGCSALTSITVESGNTVYSGDGNCLIEKGSGTLILGCKNSVIPEGVKSIGEGAFNGCTGLTSITIPASVETIGFSAFEGCSNLADVFYKGTSEEWDRITIDASGNYCLTNAKKHYSVADFGECGTSLTWKLDTNGVLTISGTGAMPDYGSAGAPWYKHCSLIKSAIIKNGVTSIGSNAFNGCTGLTSITVPYGVTSIGEYAFAYSGLASITIPSSVKTIGDYAFNGCKKLTRITLPEGLTTIGDYAFSNCTGLTSITIPSSVTTIGSGVLRECGTLTSISVASGNTKYSDDGNCLIEKDSGTLIRGCNNSIIPAEGVKSIGKSAFSGCTGLTSITIPSSVETIGFSAFAFCSELTSITIPASVISIGGYAFSGCVNLADVFYKGTSEEWDRITIDASGNDRLTNAKKHYSVADFGECGENLSWVLDTNGVLTISGSGAMTAYSSQSPAPWSSYINSITSFVIEEGVTTIGTCAFYGCAGLTSVTIPGSVTSVGYAAFSGCSVLMNVYYDGTPLDWKKISIGSSNGYLKLANIICSIPFAETVTISHDSRDITDETVDADIYRVQTYQLTATAAPYNAKQQFTWASDSTGVASVNKSGRVSFRSPGTATVTATAADGSHTGASVTFNVFYYDAAAKFTASTDAPSTGLEVNYSAQISVFGKDKTAALDPSMFEYTLSNVKNGPFIEVSDAGEITVIKPGGTTTVTAALINDPLGRKVTVSVKTVPTRTKELHIKPLDTEVIRTDDDYEDGFYAIDANGNIPFSAEEAVSYALFLNKLPKGSQKAFPLVIDATDFSDRPIPLPNTDYTWTSSNTKIATVAKDGTVTIKANVDGACTITATSKDGNKAQGTIAIYVMDKTPRLDAAKVTLDTQKTNEVTVGLVSSYGAQILDDADVVFQEYNSKAKAYADSTRIEIAGYNSENGLLTLKASGFLKNQTIKGQLVVTTKGNPTPYELPFNVVIKNSAPSVTVKQPSKLNLFYTDIGNTPVDLNVSVKNEQITSIEFEAEDFTGIDNGNGTVTVKLKEHSSTPATKATLKIHLVGYEQPVEKAITIGTVTTKPKLTVTPASAVINTLLNENYSSEFAVYNNATGDYITVADMDISAAAAEWASLTGEGTNAVLTLTGTTGGKAAISVRESNWASPITVYHTVSVKKDLPAAKLGTGTLTLNSNFLNIAETTLTLNQANLSITDITWEPTSVPKGMDKDVAEEWFEVAYADGRITAEFSDAGETAIESGALKTGTYSFSITPYVEGVDLNPVTLKISVKNTIPTVTASAVTLNKRLNETGVSTLKLSAKGYTVTGIDGLNSSPNLGIEYADGVLKVWLTDTAKALPKAQTFNVTLTPTVEMDEYDTKAAAKPFTLKVSMIDKAPSASVSASGKIDVIVKGSSITYTLTKLNNAVGSVSSAELDGANADLFTLTKLEPNDKGQPRYMLTLKDDAVCAANVTYKIKLRFTLDSEDGDVIETPVLNVKPIRSALKLTAAPAAQIFYQSQSRDRVVTYTVKLTGPAGVNIKSVNVGNVSFWQKALADNAENISINISGDTATVKVTLKDTSKLNSGKSYTLPLEISAEGYPGNISSAKLNLTLKVMK